MEEGDTPVLFGYSLGKSQEILRSLAGAALPVMLHPQTHKLTRIYAKAGIPERFRGTFYDDTHSFRPAMQDEAFDWLDRWL